VKRINDILKYFGFSCMALGLLLLPVPLYVIVFRGINTPTEQETISFCVVVFLIGCLPVLCGLIRCDDASAYEKTAIEILKYFGGLCVVSGTLLGLMRPERHGFASAVVQLSRAIITVSCGLVALVIAALYAFAKRR
jgi:hypothetical protein